MLHRNIIVLLVKIMWRWHGPVGFWISRKTEQDKSVEIGSWQEPMMLFALERYRIGFGFNPRALTQAKKQPTANTQIKAKWWQWLLNFNAKHKVAPVGKAHPNRHALTDKHSTNVANGDEH